MYGDEQPEDSVCKKISLENTSFSGVGSIHILVSAFSFDTSNQIATKLGCSTQPTEEGRKDTAIPCIARFL